MKADIALKRKMIRNRKGIMVEALMRIIIMVVLVVIVFNIGKRVAEAVGFGASNAVPSFESLVNKLNSPDLKEGESKEEFLALDSNTAVIGFSKGQDYKCYGCGGEPKDKLEAQFKRPNNNECKDSACVCICSKGLPTIRGAQPILEITCEKLQCKRLDFDIYPKVELRELIKKKYASGYNVEPSWVGGFLYARDVGDEFFESTISGLPKNYDRKITVFIEKKRVDGNTYIGVCPALPCIQEQK